MIPAVELVSTIDPPPASRRCGIADLRALLRQPDRVAATLPARGARDQRDLAFDAAHHKPPSGAQLPSRTPTWRMSRSRPRPRHRHRRLRAVQPDDPAWRQATAAVVAVDMQGNLSSDRRASRGTEGEASGQR